ncbi:2-oxo acid dehydrogenase subunit E2 [Salinibacterium sp.]|uniref:2-oxo acid dehydrogenase subunit E2 n=1 Tax=Salinibacterium sp. TaxID=1915057 RepID=UPI00286B57DA|nr:2-oxo acid dehydrogenase subunit E2 [Salinibacterium sp.]
MSDAGFITQEGVRTPLKGLRRTAARRMMTAWQAPVFHLTVEVDMTEASLVQQRVPGATVTDVFVAASAQALLAVPSLNAHVGDDELTLFPHANVGIAVATDNGLTVPVIHGADVLSLSEIATRRRDVVQRARARALVMDDVTGGTFTISNLGMMAIDRFDAILNVPQAAILAIGSTRRRYVWRGDTAVWLPIAELTLTCDHRAADGAAGATFLAALTAALTKPIVPA